MNKKLLMIPAIIAGILLGTIGYMGLQEASAHQTIKGLDFGRIVIGHDGEPAFGHKPGVWLGKHNTEVFLFNSDESNTRITNVDGLLVDKYYFKSVKSFNKADSVEDADAISKNNLLTQVFGEPGTYHSEQIIQSGIYGYRVHGDINGETEDGELDVTLFCGHPDLDPEVVELLEDGSDGEIQDREFNCPRDIDDIKFPKN